MMPPRSSATNRIAVAPVAGSLGLIQGAYGERGNLELVAPHAVDGFWVCWFDGDVGTHPGGHQSPVSVEPASSSDRWHVGLHVATGTRLSGVRITQTNLGNRNLEAVARTVGGELVRWYWTPERGFVDGGALGARSEADPSAIVADGRIVRVLTVAQGRAVELASPTAEYPQLTWTPRPTPGPARTTAVDCSGELAVLVTADEAAVFCRRDEGWVLVGPVPGRWRSARVHRVDAHTAVFVGHDIDGRIGGGFLDPAEPAGLRSTLRSRTAVDEIASCVSTLPVDLTRGNPSHSPVATLELVTRTADRLIHRRGPLDALVTWDLDES